MADKNKGKGKGLLKKLVKKGASYVKKTIKKETSKESLKKRAVSIAQNELKSKVKSGQVKNLSDSQKKAVKGLARPTAKISLGKTFDISNSRKKTKENKKLDKMKADDKMRAGAYGGGIKAFLALDKNNKDKNRNK